jgi:hypothetical protein
MLFGIPLIFFPGETLALFQFEAESFVAARLLGAGLVGIGGISLLANRAGAESYLTLLKMKMLWSGTAIVALVLSLPNGPKSTWLFLFIFAIFFVVWTFYERCLRRT